MVLASTDVPRLTEEEAFDKFYASYGFQPAPQGEVARWRNDQGLTHGCVSGPEHGPRWESKCGSDLRIQHDLNELESEVYGKVDGFYKKQTIPPKPPTPEVIEVPDKVIMGVKSAAEKVDTQTKEKFEKLYSEWREFRKDPILRMQSNPVLYCKTPAFDEITKMGPKVVPLLMSKMADGDFFCLQALNKIRSDTIHTHTKLGNALALNREETNNSEQNKAALTLIKWHEAFGE